MAPKRAASTADGSGFRRCGRPILQRVRTAPPRPALRAAHEGLIRLHRRAASAYVALSLPASVGSEWAENTRLITITFPDGASREYAEGVTGAAIAESISKSLAKKAVRH